ncbi:MAG: hypothetical protein M1380_12440, partial [Chloroflexi bacterium]|nr:hypothetical protein [Chloroflexota bacterium]
MGSIDAHHRFGDRPASDGQGRDIHHQFFGRGIHRKRDWATRGGSRAAPAASRHASSSTSVPTFAASAFRYTRFATA